MRRSTRKKLLAAVLAAGTLAGTPAFAQPVNRVDRFDSPTSSLSGLASRSQDLRGEQARDAARLAEQPQDLRGEHARDAARLAAGTAGEPRVYWSYDYQATRASPPEPPASPAS